MAKAPRKPESPTPETDSGAAGLAAWLIPSTGGALWIAGYLTQLGQTDLLGVSGTSATDSDYVHSAAEFLTAVIITLAELPSNNPWSSFSNHPRLMCLALCAIVFVTVGTS